MRLHSGPSKPRPSPARSPAHSSSAVRSVAAVSLGAVPTVMCARLAVPPRSRPHPARQRLMWPSSSSLQGHGPLLWCLRAPSLVHRCLRPPVTRSPLHQPAPAGSPRLRSPHTRPEQSRSVEPLSSVSVWQTIRSSPIRPQQRVYPSCPAYCAARSSLLTRGGASWQAPATLDPRPDGQPVSAIAAVLERPQLGGPRCRTLLGRGATILCCSSSVASAVRPPAPLRTIPAHSREPPVTRLSRGGHPHHTGVGI
ncbi:hypothetical protein NDU88_004966 [Pleurodeles waltl]|uniref:Uncharacterized protein n=1 Tax=Pleurodeles waltl TaxID=8319 RepID=A0AAV7L2U8_PLEWA|nr:hypothetical protein NDU88_004966 [Pleurodeles waltl]